MKEFIAKETFVKNSLQPFIKRLDRGIKSIYYEVDSKTQDEFCNIVYENGYSKKICVTADSEIAMTRDILKRI